jgi:hypothetical protein
LWNCISIDALETPNLKGLSLEQLLELDPVDGGPLDQNAISYLVTRRWVRDQHLTWWHGSESSSPQWMSRVRAEFPDQSQNSLIKLRWLERAKERARHSRVADVGSSPLVAGVDVGGGEAETVVFVCECRHDMCRIIAMGAWRGEDTRGQVVNFLNQYRPRLSLVRVDAIGVGLNFAHHLRDCRFHVDPINVGMPCESNPQLGENDPGRRFVNLRAQFYQALADAFERDQVEGLTDETTIGQLAGLLYEFDSQGRTRIESKEKARKRGVPSPDRADALMLALGQPYQRLECYTISDLPRLRSGAKPSADYDGVILREALDSETWAMMTGTTIRRGGGDGRAAGNCFELVRDESHGASGQQQGWRIRRKAEASKTETPDSIGALKSPFLSVVHCLAVESAGEKSGPPKVR